MRIAAVQTAVVEANYDWTYVRVVADDGTTGLGESFLAPGLTAIIAEFERLLVGEDPRHLDRLWNKLRWGASGAGSMGGIVYNAISGIEAALFDLVGKAHEVPIWQLLGGKYRERIRVYVDCHAGEALESLDPLMVPRPPSWLPRGAADTQILSGEVNRPVHGRAYGSPRPDDAFTPEMYAKRAQEAVDLGFTAIKFDLDVPNPHTLDTHSGTLTHAEVRFMAGLVEAVRDSVGDTVDIAFDCHWRYSVSDAQRLAVALEPFGLMWLEDPVPPENTEAMRRVTAATSTPIASGENYYLRQGFRDVVERGGLDIVAPDVQKAGGLLESRRIADLADVHYMPVAPHCIASPIGTMASAHLATAIPNFLALEWHGMSVPFWDDIAEGHGGPIIEQGFITVPDRPGLGITLDESVARRYAKPGTTFFGEPV